MNRKQKAIEASLYNQKLDVRAGILAPAEYVRRCEAAVAQGIVLRDNVADFVRQLKG